MAEAQHGMLLDGDNSSEDVFIKCSICKEPFSQEKDAKLLPCLHTFCGKCLEKHQSREQTPSQAEPAEGQTDAQTFKCGQQDENDKPHSTTSNGDPNKIDCPVCSVCHDLKAIQLNPFVRTPVAKTDRHSDDVSMTSDDTYAVCTSCDDNQQASQFCTDCQEWLCDPCVIAHRRVRITKDHTIITKTNDETAGIDTAIARQVFCEIHKTEKMKLFCLTCDMLTCRDCQLAEHKNHKYQFIEETVSEQKLALQKNIDILKTRIEQSDALSKKIAEKEKDIKKQQIETFNEVRQVADTITNELIGWCKQLLNFLQGVCHSRQRDLRHKKIEVSAYTNSTKQCIDFVEHALKSGDNLSILSTKSLMMKQLKTLVDKELQLPGSMFDLNIKYENEAVFLSKNVSKMGFINVNGKSYPTQQKQANQTDSTVVNITKQNFSQHVADLLNQYPVEVRDKYKNLSVDKRKTFLQQLVHQHVRKQQGADGMVHTVLDIPTNPVLQGVAVGNRPAQFSTDSNAIQDLYRMTQQHQQQQQQQTAVRPAGPYLGAGAAVNPTQRPPVGQAGTNFQGWRGGTQNTRPLQDTTPTAPGVPQGRFDIDPLNLRIKKERFENNFPPSCQFAKSSSAIVSPQMPKSMAVSPSSSQALPSSSTGQRMPQLQLHLQSAPPVSPGASQPTAISSSSSPGIQSPPPSSNTSLVSQSPGSSASPLYQDGGAASRTTISPALPDVNVMDSDRDELLKGLTNPVGKSFNTFLLHPKHDPSDPSEDYCAVCHNGGDLLCCDRCPKVFHLQCHIPVINSNLASSEVWTCSLCTPDDDLILNTAALKDDLNINGKRKAPNGLDDKQLKVSEKVLLELFCLEMSTCFHEPVSKSIPNYYKIVANPMDFATIKCKLRRGHFNHYNCVEEFIDDVKLVFKNCFTFNPESSDIFQVGRTVESYFENLLKHYMPGYLVYFLLFTTESDSTLTDGPKQKRRRSPAPGANRDSPSSFS